MTIHEYLQQGKLYKDVVIDGTDLIFLIDFKGTIFYHNDSTQQALGYAPNSLLKKNIEPYVSKKYRSLFQKKIKEAQTQKLTASVEIQFVDAHGHSHYFEFNAINLQVDSGVAGIILDCRDISARKKAEAAVIQAQHSKELFLANISHEIRTPINGISGLTHLLIQNPHHPGTRKYLEAIHESVHNLKVLISDILDMAALEVGKITLEQIDFQPARVIKNAMEVCNQDATAKDLPLELISPKKHADIVLKGDPTRLKQVLTNLMSNAIKFTTSGHVRITWQLKKLSDTNAILQFDVVDTGIGIAKQKLKTIFQSFTQADAHIKRNYGGTGLGLAIVQQLIQLQHGKISVRSTEGKGTRFLVQIPYPISANKFIPTILSASAEPRATIHLAKDILVVEDNPVNQLYISDLLKNWGARLHLVSNGLSALEAAEKFSFDMVLMDVHMPVMDGFETTRRIRALPTKKNKVPIVALSANTSAFNREACLKAGMNDFLAKPFRPNDLIDLFEKYFPHDVKRKTSSTMPPQLADQTIRDMIPVFKTHVSNMSKELKELLQQKNWKEIAKKIHQLKSSLSLMGFTDLTKESAHLEQELQDEKAVSTFSKKIKNYCYELDQILLQPEWNETV